MDEINKAIGARIKELRLDRKLSREQIGRRIGVSQQCVEKYEKGEVDISVRRLIHISNVLNVSVMSLLQNHEAFKHYVSLQIKTHK